MIFYMLHTKCCQKITKCRQINEEMDIKLSKTNIRNQVGRSSCSSLLPVARSVLPTIGKALGLSALDGLAQRELLNL